MQDYFLFMIIIVGLVTEMVLQLINHINIFDMIKAKRTNNNLF